MLYAEDARELYSSAVFSPITRSVPWFSAESVHRESDVLWRLSLTNCRNYQLFLLFWAARTWSNHINSLADWPYLPASDGFISILFWRWIRRYFSGQYLRYFWTDFDAVFCKIPRKVRAIYELLRELLFGFLRLRRQNLLYITTSFIRYYHTVTLQKAWLKLPIHLTYTGRRTDHVHH